MLHEMRQKLFNCYTGQTTTTTGVFQSGETADSDEDGIDCGKSGDVSELCLAMVCLPIAMAETLLPLLGEC